ncbi:MAG: phosphoribosylamine--glycine ligase [Micavibrio sp. TMED27]|nr:phosphoribosylamine--glycine ligase [Micavibrio sp.]OUT91253.1 MAG: phosphoribosylamine--glycine ligase [Micavibrio sp. TMED27]|tara:strand:- start:1320 stop:2618 length:1299 start_codon:yes stop_codon:yes gene_type:complete
MRVLLIGSGGREHALAWAISSSDKCQALYCAPGNAGIESCAELIDIKAEDVDGITDFAKNNQIDLVICGPEAPLVLGLADKIKALGIPVFGPNQAAAQLEGSKGFMKDLCTKYGVPTAAYGRFTDFESAKKFIEEQPHKVVVKTDGLAAGKGVIMCDTKEDAIEAARGMLEGASFGDAGSEVVIEEFLDGEELSYFALADGKGILPLTSAQDHKRAFDNDEGPNTGGMGAYSPAHLMTPEIEAKIIKNIIEPTVKGMNADGIPFTGVLFAGIMVVNGEPKLIEYNIRFGDPECQPIMMRLQSDLLEILYAAAKGELANIQDKVSWSDETTLCVVMAANGYPGSYEKNTVINGLGNAAQTDGVNIFHAGTAKAENGDILSVGGRVLGITAKGHSVQQAQERAYAAIDKIEWNEGFCRRDIGWRAIKAEKEEAA